MSELKWHLEERAGCQVIVANDGSWCCPATDRELELIEQVRALANERDRAREALAAETKRDVGHSICRSVEARLREANRRLQAEGPSLERDKLITSLGGRISEQAAEIERLKAGSK